jgi:hypothetical protein
MREMINAYKILFRTLKGKDHPEDVSDGKIILK